MRNKGSVRLIVLMALYMMSSQVGLCQSSLSDDIQKVIEEPNSQNAVFAISVKDSQGKEIYTVQSKSRMIPASTYKLVTTLTAIDVLGEDFIYETRISYKGHVNEGILNGDIMIKGSGDPSLGATRYSSDSSYVQVLRDVVSYIQDAGIRNIKGRIIVDQSYFDETWVHPSWAWDDLTNYYAGGAAAFNIHENLYFLDFARSTLADKATSVAKISPEVKGLEFVNKVMTGAIGSGDNAYIYGDPYSNKRWIEGTIPAGSGEFTIKGAIADPGQAFVQHLSDLLSDKGVVIEGKSIRYSADVDLQLIGTLCSDKLIDIVTFANHTSNNLFCEGIFKTLGAKADGIGGYNSGQEAIYNYLKSAGIDASGLRLEDGCGLSSRNRISPDFMTSFLTHQTKSQGRGFIKALIPQPGKQGTVKSFLDGYSCQNHVQVKSGSINNVLAYAGLLQGKTGQDYSICVMANGHDSNRVLRRQLEKIIEAMYIQL